MKKQTKNIDKSKIYFYLMKYKFHVYTNVYEDGHVEFLSS